MTVKRFKHQTPSGDIEFIQGFDELLDAERAKAREEQRAVDVGACMRWFDGRPPPNSSPTHLLQAESLTATPLADRIAELERERDEVRQRIVELELDSRLCVQLCDVLGREVGRTGESEGAVQVAERIIRERDEARAKCAEWEEKAKAWMASPEAAARMSGYRELADRIAELEAFAEKINAIRNSIVGAQALNWSEHVYPLVAALDAAGFVGLPYPEARANVGTLLERAQHAEAALAWMKSPAESCLAERAEGKGGCGACAVCCAEWRVRAEKAEEALAEMRDQADAVERWSTRP